VGSEKTAFSLFTKVDSMDEWQRLNATPTRQRIMQEGWEIRFVVSKQDYVDIYQVLTLA